jgi:hypothetical protein
VAAIPNNRVGWTYTDDAGQDWRVAAILGYTSQNKLGGSAASTDVPPLPRDVKMRRLSVRNAVLGKTRTVPIYEVTAPLLTPAATIMLNEWVAGELDSYAFTNDQETPVWIIPERHPRKSPITSQAS